MASLDMAIRKVMPWNMAFATLHMFLITNDFGDSELSGKSAKLIHLANFVDEIIRANARNWEEKKVYLSHQDICVRWTATVARRSGLTSGGSSGNMTNNRKKERSQGVPNGKKRLQKPPGYLCRRYNEGR
jgi:hypothetical protein